MSAGARGKLLRALEMLQRLQAMAHPLLSRSGGPGARRLPPVSEREDSSGRATAAVPGLRR
jgi:hypothetical protein